MDIKDKVAIVTGGASGLGRATAEVLARQGAKVAIFDLNDSQGQQAVAELGADKVAFFAVDVTSETSVQQAVDQVVSRFGALHLCVNCAGICPAARTLNRDGEPMPLSGFSTAININLVGSFNVARVAAAAMAKNEPVGEAGERGVIINTASVAAYEGQIGQTAYAASKGGIVGLTLPLARDLAPQGIRAMAIAPGIMGTPMIKAMPENVQTSLVANIQFPKRLGLPAEDFAGLVVHIAENAYLNGETIRLDGGIRMGPK
ncbi:SDR family NAD(P)-dependent oxidoreductase [Porticoccus sp. GXU_MW_L64]